MCFATAFTAMGMSAASAATAAAATSAAIGIAGVGLSAYGMYQNAQAQNAASQNAAAQAQYQSQVAKQNADMANAAAREDRYQGYLNSEAQKRKTAQVIGEQRAAEGASGAVVDNGSFMDVTLDTAERGTLDALALQHQGDIQAWKDEIQATNYTNQAALQSASAAAYGSQYHDPLMAAGGSLLQGAGQIGMNWYKMTNSKGEA